MRVDIRDLQNEVKIDPKRVIKCAKSVLKGVGEDKAELSLLFVNDSYIRRLNRRYRRVNSKTDVLAFSMREGKGPSKHRPILGDVVISAETAKREAKKRKRTLHKEMTLYLVHGILHLLGYDDKNPCDRKMMRAKEKELLEAV